MRSVTVDLRKWPDVPGRVTTGRVLGVDEYGTWIGVPADPGGVLDGEVFVMLIRTGGWWKARHFSDGGWKVDIATPPEWDGDVIRLIDLDLDVRRLDGRVWVEDEDEFEERHVTRRYPGDIVVHARQATAEVVAALHRDDEPFCTAGDGWLRQARQPE